MGHGSEHQTITPTELPDDPLRIPIEGPKEHRFISTAPDFTTTHVDFLGRWYQIKNGSWEEAQARHRSEKARNERLSESLEEHPNPIDDPLANGLYRLTKNDLPMRPAHSDHDSPFMEAVAEAGKQDADGNYDIGDDSKQIGRGGPAGNSAAAIAERSSSIVISNIARDEALEYGSTLEKAKTIGAAAYQEEERFRHFNNPNAIASQPEASSVEAAKGPVTAEPNTKEKQEHSRIERTKQLFRKIGRNSVIKFSANKEVGAFDTVHVGAHETEDIIERLENNAREAIEDLPLLRVYLGGLALELAIQKFALNHERHKEIVRRAKHVNRLAKDAEKRTSKATIVARAKNVVRLQKDAEKQLAENMKLAAKIQKEEEERRKAMIIGRAKHVAALQDQDAIDKMARDKIAYLLSEHPQDLRYKENVSH